MHGLVFLSMAPEIPDAGIIREAGVFAILR
jgi:hypothetical protein